MVKGMSANTRAFRPPAKKKVFDEVYEQLFTLINNGRLKPGDQLPPERALANDLKVSRQSIREAIKKAESRGFLQVRQGEGTFVLSVASHLMEAPLLDMMQEEIGKVYEFMEIRMLLEVWCARKAAELTTVRELKRMEKALTQMEKLVDSKENLGQTDIDFHAAIAEASHNTLMMHMIAMTKQIFLSMFRISNFTRRPEKNRILFEQHRQIYEAVRDRNPDLAGKCMEDHLRFGEKEWREEIAPLRMKGKGRGPSGW